ncbi:MAG: hypothetical protein ACE5GE_03225 [Phycisphaerae bacterium]
MKIKSLAIVDAIGAATALACAAGGMWFGFVGSDQTTGRIDLLTEQVAQLSGLLEGLQAARLRQEDIFHQRSEAFGGRDLLPEASPVEHELRTVTDLAREHGLDLTGLVPLGYWDYPGLREVRYRMTAKGTYTSYVRFLHAFEQAASWSDVTYLRMDSADPQVPNDKYGELTVSLYAAAPRTSLAMEKPRQ